MGVQNAATGVRIARRGASDGSGAGGGNLQEPAADRETFDLAALKSEVMVLATSCHEEERYNAFVQRYKTSAAGQRARVRRLFQARVRPQRPDRA